MRISIILDCFDHVEFALVDLIHEFPRALFLVGDLLNFKVEE